PWRRHLLDSAQLFPHVPREARVLVDLGSGAGLPGLILSILGVPEVHLVESDQRKCAFLYEAARITGAACKIHPVRIEKMPPLKADGAARGPLATLPDPLDMAEPFLVTHSILLLWKGKGAGEELTRAQESWTMKSRLLPSLSDPEGQLAILEAPKREPRD